MHQIYKFLSIIIAKLAISYFIQLNKDRTLEYEHMCSDLSKYDQINPKLVQKAFAVCEKNFLMIGNVKSAIPLLNCASVVISWFFCARTSLYQELVSTLCQKQFLI